MARQDCEDLSTLDPKQKKRAQNRVAQRTYRRNQKQRVQALELAVAEAARDPVLPRNTTTATTSIAVNRITREETWDERSDQPLCLLETLAPQDLVQEQRPKSPPTTSTNIESAPWDDFALDEPVTHLNRPALHRAASNSSQAICRMLLEGGADISKQDSNGLTALHVAVETGDEEVIRLLLKDNDPNVKDSLGRTALFEAVMNSNEAVTRLLLELAVDVDCPDILGEVVLHIAVDQNLESMVALLLSYGANVNA